MLVPGNAFSQNAGGLKGSFLLLDRKVIISIKTY